MGLELSLKQEPPKVFVGDDEFKGRSGTVDLVREVDEHLKKTGQMGLIVGGILTKELPRKDLDVIISGEDIRPGELGVDWWWVDLSTGQTRNICDFRIDVSSLARRALSKRIPGLYILRDVFDVKNENLPASYTSLHELTRDYSSSILDARLFRPVQIQYLGEDLIGVLQAYDDVFIELRDTVVFPGIKNSEHYGFVADFGNIHNSPLKSSLLRAYFSRLLVSLVPDPEELERINSALYDNTNCGWGRRVDWKEFRECLYDIFNSKGFDEWGQRYTDAIKEGKQINDARIEEILTKMQKLRLEFDESVDIFRSESSCYSFIRDHFSFADYFNAFGSIEPQPAQPWDEKPKREQELVQRGSGRYIGNLVINKLSIGEIR